LDHHQDEESKYLAPWQLCHYKALPLYSVVLAVLGHRLTGSDDESGDLGFGPRASKHFILAAVIARNPSEVGRCIKRVREQRLPKKYKQIPELKYQ
jgi:hypothetical protein